MHLLELRSNSAASGHLEASGARPTTPKIGCGDPKKSGGQGSSPTCSCTEQQAEAIQSRRVVEAIANVPSLTLLNPINLSPISIVPCVEQYSLKPHNVQQHSEIRYLADVVNRAVCSASGLGVKGVFTKPTKKC